MNKFRSKESGSLLSFVTIREKKPENSAKNESEKKLLRLQRRFSNVEWRKSMKVKGIIC